MLSPFRRRLLLLGLGVKRNPKRASNSFFSSSADDESGRLFSLPDRKSRGGGGAQNVGGRNAIGFPEGSTRARLPGAKAKPRAGEPSYYAPPEKRLGAFEKTLLAFTGSAADRCDFNRHVCRRPHRRLVNFFVSPPRYPWARVEPPDKVMVCLSRECKNASEHERRRLVDKNLQYEWRKVGSDALLDAWRAVVCFR